MSLRRVGSAVAALLGAFSATLLVPVVVALGYESPDLAVAGVTLPESAYTFLLSFLAIQAVAFPLRLATRSAEEEDLSDREGYLTVALAWVVVPLFAMLPFMLSSAIRNPFHAYVEAASALTTTGFSTLPNPGTLDPSLLLWRALLQWLGAIAVVALGMALLSKLTHGGLRLAPHDATVQTSKRLRPKMVDTAKSLLLSYATITLALMLVLGAIFVTEGNTPKEAAFEAAVHMLSALSTGGLARTVSVGALSLPALAVLAVAMGLGATSYQVLLMLRSGNLRAASRDPEWRFLLLLMAIGSAIVGLSLILAGRPWGVALPDGVWNVVSAMTGTGLRLAEPVGWPVAASLVLLMLILVGGCSGSAAGGLKVFRILILLKIVQRQLRVLLHPRAVAQVRVGRTVIPDATVTVAVAYTFTFILLWLAGTITLAVLEPHLSPLAAASGAGAALSNVGLALDGFAPGGSLAALNSASQAVVLVLMWLGRLEIFAAVLLFYPSSWRH